jgi:4'-phosphopantetheinyl transferase EntD
MIDQLALALGHGLLAVALLRLALREDVDVDPLVEELKEEAAEKRRAASPAGRKAARRAARDGKGPDA